MKDSLLKTPMNHLAKFYAAGFILAGGIRNSARTQNCKQTINKQLTIYPHFTYRRRHVWIKSVQSSSSGF